MDKKINYSKNYYHNNDDRIAPDCDVNLVSINGSKTIKGSVRYDNFLLENKKAELTAEGYLIDTPIVGRVGIQLYKNADGTIRREFRPADEVFNEDSLSTYDGKPITDGHPDEYVTSKNAKNLSVGFIKSFGLKDESGKNVKAQIVVHDGEMIEKALNGGVRELSLGYRVDMDETPGEWEGQHYDAVQRNIYINHLAFVPKGRAGNARLNIDRLDAVSFNFDEEKIMSENLSRIRLDNGLEYQAAPEVAVEVAKLRNSMDLLKTQVDELMKKLDVVSAERDTIKSQVQNLEKVRSDALEAARAEVKARAELDKIAESFKIDGEGKSDKDLKKLVIKTVRADASLDEKSDEYINAAFDLAVSMRDDFAMAAQRQSGFSRNDKLEKDEPNTYKSYMAKLGKKE